MLGGECISYAIHVQNGARISFTSLFVVVGRMVISSYWKVPSSSPFAVCLQVPTRTRMLQPTSKHNLRVKTVRQTRRFTVTWLVRRTRTTSRWYSTRSPTSSLPTTFEAAAYTDLPSPLPFCIASNLFGNNHTERKIKYLKKGKNKIWVSHTHTHTHNMNESCKLVNKKA